MYVVILTGAGISAESGLGTFRDKDGFWANIDLAEVATPEGFASNPEKVHEFYNARRAGVLNAKPNAAHLALARLESEFDGTVVVITQNIDDLHHRAGSRKVLHMHGEILKGLCVSCGNKWEVRESTSSADMCPHCGGGPTRPDVVWFGEIPYHLDEIDELIGDADIFAAIGTSGQVFPAAGFAHQARSGGARTVELNLVPTELSREFDDFDFGPATRLVPEWVDRLLGEG